MKILIIGGGAGGAGAATRCRRQDENAEIIVFERSGYASYSNCGLPYKFSDEIAKFGDLIMTTPEKLKSSYKLDVRTNSEVIKVNSENKEVTVVNKVTGEEYVETFDKLIISAGASAVVPGFPGIKDTNHVFTLKTPDDVMKAENFIKDNTPKEIVVVGGGFIGAEIAENFIHSGYKVTLIDASENLLAIAVDPEFSE